MKLSSFFICLAFALPYFCVAQINVDTIPKNVNVIEIVTGLSMEENFTLAGQALVEKGLEIAQTNKEFGHIMTALIRFKAMKCKFILLSKESKIRLTGEFIPDYYSGYNADLFNLSPGKITNFGMKGNLSKKAFISMLELAQKIAPPGSKLIFSIAE
jgi:hypothetical protein